MVVQAGEPVTGGHVLQPPVLESKRLDVALQAGETATVAFDLPASELAWYNDKEREWQIESMSYEVYVGGSSANEDLLKEAFSIR